jgi:hypothetical protein
MGVEAAETAEVCAAVSAGEFLFIVSYMRMGAG